jgi:RimJ/RimL family protein N-acetyltransferase
VTSLVASSTLHYRQPTLGDAPMLLEWRCRPDITRFMFTDISPDLAAQEAWLQAAATRAGFTHRVICLDEQPVGYGSITVTDEAAAVGTIGVYLADRRSRSGIAGFNFIHLLNHAFLTLGLRKIVNHILGGNARLIRAQQYNGYRHVGVLHRHVRKYGEFHDVHIFEQHREDWLVFRRKFGDLRDLDGIEQPEQPAGDGN